MTTMLKGNGKADFRLVQLPVGGLLIPPSIPISMADETRFWQEFNQLTTTVVRMDERQKAMADDVSTSNSRLLKLEETLSTRQQNDLDWRRSIEDRLKAVEGAGMAAWSWKKLAQLAVFVSVCGGLLGAMVELARWIAAHWK